MDWSPALPTVASSVEEGGFPAFNPEKSFRIYDIIVFARKPTEKDVMYSQIERANGEVLLQFYIHPRSTFRWVAAPGMELVDPAKDPYRIVNKSDEDLDVVMLLQQGDERYQFADGKYTNLGSIAREPMTDEELAELERESDWWESKEA